VRACVRACVRVCVRVCSVVCVVKTMEKAFYLLLMCDEIFHMCTIQETRFNSTHQRI